MKQNDNKDHDAEIIDQFSRQAIPFMQLPGHMDSIQMLIEFSRADGQDLVLDVACGPGLVACEFARVCRHVTGIDITERMIIEARKRQLELGLANMSWDLGTVAPLPYADETFSLVLSRYSFHHFLEPKLVLAEMLRVCKPGGGILIADVALPVEKAAAFNHLEKLRDPSHTRALSVVEWEQLLGVCGLKDLKHTTYRVEMELEKQLKASFPNPGDDQKIRELFRQDIGLDALGFDAHIQDHEIHYSFPISIFAGIK